MISKRPEKHRGAQVLEGHTNSVTSVAFSLDGAHIVSGSYDDTVRVWDAQSGAEVRRLEGHTNNVTSVAFSPDGAHIVSGSWDQTVRVWDAQSGAEVHQSENERSSAPSPAIMLAFTDARPASKGDIFLALPLLYADESLACKMRSTSCST
jgi:WD40 repeat protein